MSIEKKIFQEIRRHHQINKYVTEQEVAPDVAPTILDPNAPPSTDPMAGGQTPPLGATDPMLPQDAPTPEIIDVSQDDEVEKIGSEGQTDGTESGTEELEITDLVNAQKDIQSKQEEHHRTKSW